MFTDNSSLGHLLSDISTLYGNYTIVAIITVFLGIASYTDMTYLKIRDTLNITFGIIAVVLIPFFGFSFGEMYGKIGGLVIGFLALFIPAMIRNHQMGGDIKAMAVLGLFLGIYITPVFLAIASVLGAIYLYAHLALRKPMKTIPFAPFFLASHLILFLLSFVLPVL